MDKNELEKLILQKTEQCVDKILRGEISSDMARMEILRFMTKQCVGDCICLFQSKEKCSTYLE